MFNRIARYDLIEPIGFSQAGIVYRAIDKRLKRPVALELLFTTTDALEPVRRERLQLARAWSRLSHPNLVTIYDVVIDKDLSFVAMEPPDGSALSELLAERTALPIEELISMMLQLCCGLERAHREGVVHGDIKPADIFVHDDGTVTIGDFEIFAPTMSSKDEVEKDKQELESAEREFEEARYTSPEQLHGTVDARSDQYSLAAVFSHLVATSSAGVTAQQTAGDGYLWSALTKIIHCAMNCDPAARYPDLHAMGIELGRLLERVAQESYRRRRAPMTARAAAALSAWRFAFTTERRSGSPARAATSPTGATTPNRWSGSNASLAALAAAAVISLSIAGASAIFGPEQELSPQLARTATASARPLGVPVQLPVAAAPLRSAASQPLEVQPATATETLFAPGARSQAQLSRDAARAARFSAVRREALDYAIDLHLAAQRMELEGDVEFEQSGFAAAARLYDTARERYQLAERRAQIESAAIEKARIDAQVAADAQARYAQSAYSVRSQPEDGRIRPLIIDVAHQEPTIYRDDEPRAHRNPSGEIRETRPINGNSYAAVFAAPPNGRRGGGTWGACWRSDPEAARACARASCEQRSSTGSCVESAASRPGQHCAVASAKGYGVSTGACSQGQREAEGAALARCRDTVAGQYGGATSECSVAWSTAG